MRLSSTRTLLLAALLAMPAAAKASPPDPVAVGPSTIERFVVPSAAPTFELTYLAPTATMAVVLARNSIVRFDSASQLVIAHAGSGVQTGGALVTRDITPRRALRLRPSLLADTTSRFAIGSLASKPPNRRTRALLTVGSLKTLDSVPNPAPLARLVRQRL